MNCANCGKPTVGNAVLCRECAAEERRRRQPTGRKSHRTVIGLSIALGIVTALVLGLVIYLFASADDRAITTAKLRVQQEELDRREWQLSQSEDETSGLTEQIAQLQADNESLRQQIHTLDSQLGAVDSERNQNTSNYIQQVAELEQTLRQLEATQKTLEDNLLGLQTNNEALTKSNEELQEQLELMEEIAEERDALQEELDDLQDRYDLLVENYRNQGDSGQSSNITQYLDYKKKADFLDSYIVFVLNDSTGYYHTYDCPDFTNGTFWAYNRSLAKSQGYTACPRCGGGG